jgi:SAM-dependent methyltransferase
VNSIDESGLLLYHHGTMEDAPTARDFLRRYMQVAPIALAIVRAEECALFARTRLEHPILDIGCGDGLFASVALREQVDVGLDLDPGEIALARPRGAYRNFVVANGDQIPFPENTFATVISNCVFEHIPSFFQAFQEIHRVLRPGGRYIFTCHSHHYDDFLFFPALFRKLGWPGLRRRYLEKLNVTFKHFNCYSPEKWSGYLAQAGFEHITWQYYLPRRNEQRFDQFLLFSLPAYLNKRLLGRWVLVPKGWMVDLCGAFGLDHGHPVEAGGALFFIAEKPSS